MSGVGPVSANAEWSAQDQAHSCYMLQNGITHDESPGNPGYSSGGDIAGNSGNVAVSSSVTASARNHIDLWMTGPFHAIGILRHNLRTQRLRHVRVEQHPHALALGGNARRAARTRQLPAAHDPDRVPGQRGDGARPLVRDRGTEPDDDVRMDRCRRRAADRDDAERRHRRQRRADRAVGPDRDLFAAQGQRVGRYGAGDPRRRQRGDRHAPRAARRRQLHGHRQLQRRQRHVVVHRQPQRSALRPACRLRRRSRPMRRPRPRPPATSR